MAPPRDPNPTFTPTPSKPTDKAPPGVESRAAELFKRFGGWKKYWGNIKNAAYRWKVDPVELLSLFIFENGKADPKARSSVGAAGLAQIYDGEIRKDLNPAQYDTFIQEWANGDPRITRQMKENPAFSIQYAAWRMGGSRGKYASLDEWYRSPGYNPGFTGDSRGAGPSIYVGKYQPSVPQTPSQKAGSALDVAGASAALTTRWAVRNKDGSVSFSKPSAEPPRGTIRAFGAPIDQNGFLRAKKFYNDTYQAYVGKNAPDSAVAHILSTGLSDYALANRLAKSPSFKNGEVYKRRAGGIIEYAKGLFGGNWKGDQDLVRQAIVQNWDEGTLVSKLKARPEYLKGPEFKKGEAGLLNVYQSIMGAADDKARVGIKEAVLGGWSADQYATYLRGSKEYTSSPEYQSKALTFLEAMGLITGQQAVLTPGAAPVNPAQQEAPPPDSTRIPGKPALTRPSTLVPGGSLG